MSLRNENVWAGDRVAYCVLRISFGSGETGLVGSGSCMGRAITSARSVRYRRPWRVNSRANSNCTGDIGGHHRFFRFGTGFDPGLCVLRRRPSDLNPACCFPTARPVLPFVARSWVGTNLPARNRAKSGSDWKVCLLFYHAVVGSITDARKCNGED